MPPDDLADRLAAVVGTGNVLDGDSMAGFETDWTGRWTGRARLVVRPGSTQEVAAVMKVCSYTRTPVVAQGGNTGLVGGGVPRNGEVVLSLRNMCRVETPDKTGMSVVADAGATLGSLHSAASACGLAFGIDMASRDSATVGGMIATNAGGIHFLRHGSMRDQIIAIEAVGADGALLGRVPGLQKDNTGYDLAALLAGSEGTLAVVTRAHLRLVPAAEERAVALLAFRQTANAIGALESLRPVLRELSALELLDDESLEFVSHHRGIAPPFPRRHGAYLLVEVAGAVGCGEDLLVALETAGGFEDSAVALSEPDIGRLWQWRDGVTEAVAETGVPLKFDISLPLAEIPRFEDSVRRRVARVAPNARVVLFGHAGDGNVHVNVVGERDDDEVEDVVFALVARLQGSISAEHGIGVARRGWLHLSRSPADVDAFRHIKQALDPAGLLNPGVLLP